MKKLYFLPALLLLNCTAERPSDKDLKAPESRDFVRVGSGPSGMEGPAVSREGFLYFVNADRNGNIGRVNLETERFDLLVDSLPNGSFGNGIRFNRSGEMFVADYINHNVLKVDPTDGSVSIYAHEDRMNQPNDLAVMRSGILFASDPKWSEGTGQLWRIDLDGTATLLEAGMGTTNGVEVSPDEKALYVNESVQRNVWAYDLNQKGEITNKRLLHQFEDHGMDGMRCDEKGNLYITRHGKGTVAVLSPGGEIIMEIQMTGKKPSNIAFGGKEGKTCFVTLQDRGYIETFEAPNRGRSVILWENTP